MIENRARQSVEEFAYRLQAQGMDLSTYLKYMGGTIDQFKDTFKPQAESQVKIRLALEKIAELEKIEVSEEDLNAEFEKMAKDYNMEVDQIKASVPADDLKKDLAVQKAMDVVKAAAVVADVDKKSEKTEEKKPAAKKTSTAKKSTATKKADGEKAPAKSTATKKADGEKAPAKKTTTKKADGEKAPAKKSTSTAKKTTTKKAEDKGE